MKSSSLQDPLSVLEVFDCMEVGPVILEKKRLSMPYVLHYNGRKEATRLIYSYHEPVFDPSDAASLNLAGMIGAQLAINYGLFCRQIIYKGIFDSHDQAFIREMTDNTSCEIYVKKFLEEHPFITGRAAHLPVVRKDSYTRAEIVFQDTGKVPSVADFNKWHTHHDRYCVLSSGGKDSLLSYGLMKELSEQVHPIFINESGRHWFTALNAFRYLEKSEPHTARVWCNSDRVFNWMKRRMPFVRKDFDRFRMDEYPIRLWTVAVFLFGALPLMRKRGLGRLLIGNEFDTTRNLDHNGIRHFDGLYDQSRYFDEALSRYFTEKNWNIGQFSILRPLAEIMIQKILVKRYPLLQQQQVSCHAAHHHNGRILPCGNCEKCRRIVGILIAMDENPRNCGYTDEQIKNCLASLATTRVNQSGEDAGHLYFLLEQKNLLPQSTDAPPAFEHPDTLSIRFEATNSPENAIPDDIKGKLVRAWEPYTQGISTRKTVHHLKY